MAKGTDNSHLMMKVLVREEMLRELGKTDVSVLECYGGNGVIWSTIEHRNPQLNIRRLSIEKEKGKNPLALPGDNLKWLPRLDLSRFDIIDLDAYGHPAKQLEIIAKKHYSGYVAITDINSMMGATPRSYLEAAGISKEKYRKCPTVFNYLSDRLLENFLYICKAKRLKGYFLKGERKNYFYTQLNQL